MTSATQTAIPAGSALLRSFRFDGLTIGQAEEPRRTADPGFARCDVLVALDLAGAAGGTLADRLADAAGRIGKDGVLLLAMPNRFSLRFWSGCPEPASGRLFATLSSAAAAPTGSGHFVSRRELQEALTGAGLVPLEWFFPVLDADLSGESGALLSEQLVAAAPALAAELASARPSADRRRPRLDLFPEALVARELALAGLFPEFADHFLVAAAARQAATTAASALAAGVWTRLRPPEPEVGWHYPAGRKDPTRTVFELGANGVTVRKCGQPGGTAPGQGGFLWSAPAETPLAAGEPLRLRLQEHLVAGRSDPFLNVLADLFLAIRDRFGREGALAGEALDAILTNATRESGGAIHLFDLEWRAPAGVGASWWVLRNVLACLTMRGPRFPGAATGAQLYTRLCQRLDVPSGLAADLVREAEFGAAVSGSRPEEHAERLAAALERPWPVPVLQGLDTAGLHSHLELATAHQDLTADYRRLEDWLAEVQQLRASAEEEYHRLESWANDVQRANATLLDDYRQLESWATEVQRTNETLLAAYRRLEAWARGLEEQLLPGGNGPRT